MISIIICTYNREKYIGPLLESIAKNDYSKSEYEILLVDNNCTDNTRSVCNVFAQQHADINFRYVVEPEQGLSAAVYTQLSDVEDELNGLVTYDRKIVKIETDIVKEIIDVGI